MSQRCPNCGHQNKPGTAFCAECGSRLTASRKPPVNLQRLALLLIPALLFLLFGEGSSVGPLLFSLLVSALVTYFIRREIVALLQRAERLPALRPAWELQSKIPANMRRIAGVVAAFILSYFITETTEWGGLQSMIISILVSTPVAYFFMRKPFL